MSGPDTLAYRIEAGAPWRDEGTLRELYTEEGMSGHEIADELGCSSSVAYEWLSKYDITEGRTCDD